MARVFDNAQSEYLEREQAVMMSHIGPMAMVCWFNTNEDVGQTMIWLGDHDVNDREYCLMIYSTTAKIAAYAAEPVGHATWAIAADTHSKNVWNHACALFVSATDRRILLNGGSKGTDATALTPPGPPGFDRTSIGRLGRSNPAWYMSGLIAEAAIYDLSAWPGATDSDKADNFEKILPSLTKLYTPKHYPLGRVAYWDLIRDLNDRVGGFNLTAHGPIVFVHPRIIVPCGVL